jgi:hypothetical protein
MPPLVLTRFMDGDNVRVLQIRRCFGLESETLADIRLRRRTAPEESSSPPPPGSG